MFILCSYCFWVLACASSAIKAYEFFSFLISLEMVQIVWYFGYWIIDLGILKWNFLYGNWLEKYERCPQIEGVQKYLYINFDEENFNSLTKKYSFKGWNNVYYRPDNENKKNSEKINHIERFSWYINQPESAYPDE